MPTFSLDCILFPISPRGGFLWQSVSTAKPAITKTATRMTRVILFILRLCETDESRLGNFVCCCLCLKGLPGFLKGQKHIVNSSYQEKALTFPFGLIACFKTTAWCSLLILRSMRFRKHVDWVLHVGDNRRVAWSFFQVRTSTYDLET